MVSRPRRRRGAFLGKRAVDQGADAARDLGAAVYVVPSCLKPAVPADGRERRDAAEVRASSDGVDRSRFGSRERMGQHVGKNSIRGGKEWPRALNERSNYVSDMYRNRSLDRRRHYVDGRHLCAGREQVPQQEQEQEKRRETWTRTRRTGSKSKRHQWCRCRRGRR